MALVQLQAMKRGIAVLMLAVGVPSLVGCGSFFVYPGSLTGTGTSGGDYAYVANSSTASTSINGYSLSSGTLAAISGFPLAINITPQAMVVTPNDSLLFIASTFTSSTSPGLIYSWTIGSAGALTVNNNGNFVAGGLSTSSVPTSLAVTPNGTYLFSLDSAAGTLNEYQISSNGTLASVNAVSCAISGYTLAANQVFVAPSGKWVVCAMGTAGEVAYPLNQSTGALGTPINLVPASGYGDFAITIDNNDELYVARTGFIVVYYLDSTSPGTAIAQQATSAQPRGITLDHSGSYVYVSNYGNSTISGFSISGSGSSLSLTALSGSPFASATDVTAIAADNSGKYFMSLGYNAANGIQLYSLSSGILTATGNVAGSGSTTTIPAVMALTH